MRMEQFVLQKTFTLRQAINSYKGAVAQVVMNRIEHSSYDNVCDVVYQARWRENWKGNMVNQTSMSVYGSCYCTRCSYG